MSKVLVPIANGNEDIEAITIIDVLRRGGVEVTVASIHESKQIVMAHGTKLEADVAKGTSHLETIRLQKSEINRRLISLLRNCVFAVLPMMDNQWISRSKNLPNSTLIRLLRPPNCRENRQKHGI